jgi:hypothetical protein
MSIAMVSPLSAGNAAKLVLFLPEGASYQRILCKSADTFSGPADSGALTVVDFFTSIQWVDARDSLLNGTQVYYRAYDWIDSAWVDQGVSFPVTPAATWTDASPDVQEFVRDRVQLGITAAIAKGLLSPPSGTIQVTTAPFSLAENTSFPTISVHHESSAPEVRGIGDTMEDYFDALEDKWIGDHAWLARTALNIVAVSQNADERIQLRKVVRQIIQANLPVFAAASIELPEISQTDTEEFRENNVPLYICSTSFTCLAPAVVRYTEGTIAEVDLDVGVTQQPPIPPDYYGSYPI